MIERKTPPFALLGGRVFLAAALLGARRRKRAAASPFLRKPQVCGQWGALCQKRGFGTREKFFVVHENLGELTPAIFRDLEGSALCGALF